MTERVFFKLALRGLRRNRRRSLITLSAVAIGLAALVFLWGYVDGINRQMVDNITGYLTGHLQVHQRGYHDDPTLDLTFARADELMRRFDTRGGTIAAIAPRIETQALASGPEKTRGVMVLGIDPARERRVTTLFRALKDGEYLDAADRQGAVLGERTAAILGVKVGGEVALVTQAADGSIGAARFRVRGIYRSGIDVIDASFIVVTLAAVQELLALDGQVTTLAIRLGDIDDVPRSVAQLRRELGPDFEVLGWEALMPELSGNVALHNLFATIILFVVFVVITLSIANTVLMGVMERSHEFGVMLALGTRPAQVARIVLYEALLLGVGAAVLGGAIGAGVTGYFGYRGVDLGGYSQAVQMMPGLTGVVHPGVRLAHLLLLAATLLATTVCASVYPAWKAARLSPIAAIRGARQPLRRRLPMLRVALAWLPRAVFARIALRGIARNPRRTLLTLGALGAGLAAYLFLSALTSGFFLQMRDNATDLITSHLQVERKGFRDEFDAKLTLTQTDELLARVRANPLVAAATPRLQAQTMASSPTKSEPLMVYGVDPLAETMVTTLHRKIVEGTYLSGGRGREIVIGRKLAERLRVRLGEKIVLMAPAADGSLGSAALRIVGIVETGNDMFDRTMAVTNLAIARELLAVPNGMSAIAVRLYDIDAVDGAAATITAGLAEPAQQVVTWKTLLPEVVQMLSLIRMNLRVILIVVFVVVALGVMNTLLMAVLERTREFGLELALGTRPAQIVRTVLYESLGLGALGLGAGIVAGALVVGYFHTAGFDLSAYSVTGRIPGLTSVIYPTILFANVWLPTSALFVTSTVAALYPAWRAARLDPVQALRNV
ncbi:MAG: ABC transporter permease [Gammaproteobacteria bacterium]|nr:ABC transporter permease [Gammaproteobacteria bacterium]